MLHEVAAIVVVRGFDPLLPLTLRHLRDTMREGDGLYLVPDGMAAPGVAALCRKFGATLLQPPGRNWRGVGPARDYGLLNCNGRRAVVCDPHVKLPEEWAAIARAQSPMHVGCFATYNMNANFERVAGDGLRLGSDLITKGTTSRGEQVPYMSRWLHEGHGNPVLVPLALGGVYIIDVERYCEIGRPWQHLGAWGTSEQWLCMANAEAGGENVCHQAACGHHFRDANSMKMPYRVTAEFLQKKQANRLALVNAFTRDPEERAELVRWFWGNELSQVYRAEIQFFADRIVTNFNKQRKAA